LAVLLFPDIYPPPWITEVTHTGDEVFIAWSDVRMTADKYRGYLIEAWLCQDGELVFTPVNIGGLTTVLYDESGCSEPSWGASTALKSTAVRSGGSFPGHLMSQHRQPCLDGMGGCKRTRIVAHSQKA
jgi:hypothetical protein